MLIWFFFLSTWRHYHHKIYGNKINSHNLNNYLKQLKKWTFEGQFDKSTDKWTVDICRNTIIK